MALLDTRGPLAAGLAAAFGASACCVAPLVLASVGLGGAWAASLAALEPARPLFILVAVAFMGIAFARLYLTPARCEPGEACAPDGVRRRQRAAFWVATLFAVALIAAPWVVG